MQREQRAVDAHAVSAWRARHGLSQRQAAVALRVAKRTVQSWEWGERPIPAMLELAMAEAARRLGAARGGASHEEA